MTSRAVSFFVFAVLMAALALPKMAEAQGLMTPSPLSTQENYKVSPKEPDINGIPVLANIVRGGAKLYYVGERSGMHGWFIVKDGQIQVIYLSPDRQTALIGAMFTDQGENVTGPQINALAARNKEIYQLLNGAAQQQNQITQAGGSEGGAASVPSDPAVANLLGDKMKESPLAAVPLSPGERLYNDLKVAAGVVLGNPQAPEIMVVVAPKCPNCKRTWSELRDPVKEGQLQVRLIPVYNSVGGEEANQAAQLLVSKNPLEAWDKYAGGDQKALDGAVDEIALKAVVANLNLVSKWNIKGYPYIVYRGKDGRIKIVQGRPERMAAILLDLHR